MQQVAMLCATILRFLLVMKKNPFGILCILVNNLY
ncbi:hypothetical protein GLYMA_05G087950v4 [Glycine max]|nr:hypothetical protein GLYMA_05G087950v4 [Glycine max]KAH1133368.1 hypothetical protein GYH30_011974 [Glycine max]